MASSTDPLTALRGAVKSQTPASFIKDGQPTPSLNGATHIVLGPQSFPRNAPTRLRKPDATTSVSDPSAEPSAFFGLDAVYLAWLGRESSGAEYVKVARDNGLSVGFISVTERKTVADWLEGKAVGLKGLIPAADESTTPPGSPPQRAGALPGSSSSGQAGDGQTRASKRPYVVDSADAAVVKKIKQAEIELRDRNSVLRGVKKNDFSSVRQALGEKLKKSKDTGKSSSAATSSAATPDAKHQARKARHMMPIIMISSSPTALITMHNVKKFLQEAIFEPSQDARARAAAEGNTRPEDMIPVYRKRTTIDPSGRETEQRQTYYVVDSVEALSKFGPDAWDRVVCVMTTGQAWQFRPYKWNEPKTLFHHVKGVYVCWSNDPTNTKIKDWNVTPLKIDPHRRHVDKSVVAEFWKILDGWTLANKPFLMK